MARPGDVFSGDLDGRCAKRPNCLALDYVGIDCGIDPDGKLPTFEADNALIVHLLDDPAMFGTSTPTCRASQAALDAMVRRRVRV